MQNPKMPVPPDNDNNDDNGHNHNYLDPKNQNYPLPYKTLNP